MTIADHPTGANALLASDAMQRASDAALGCILLAVAATAFWDARGASSGLWDPTTTWFFPSIVGYVAVGIGILLLVRAAFFLRRLPSPWRLREIAMVVAAFVVLFAMNYRWGFVILLNFGPPEYAAFFLVHLMALIALARWSRLRAAGLVMLGLMLSAVGMDSITGQLALTFGLEQLVTGIMPSLVALGLFIVGDSLVCLVSPSGWFASYAWLQHKRRESRLPAAVAIVARVVAALAIAAACYFEFSYSGRFWEVGLLLVFGAFGVACKLLGWNRLVLVMACLYGDVLGKNLRHTVLLTQADPSILQGPISGTLLAASIAIFALIIVLAVRRAPSRRRVATA